MGDADITHPAFVLQSPHGLPMGRGIAQIVDLEELELRGPEIPDRLAVLIDSLPFADDADLGGDESLIAHTQFLQPPADDRFGRGIGGRGVDDRATAFQQGPEHLLAALENPGIACPAEGLGRAQPDDGKHLAAFRHKPGHQRAVRRPGSRPAQSEGHPRPGGESEEFAATEPVGPAFDPIRHFRTPLLVGAQFGSRGPVLFDPSHSPNRIQLAAARRSCRQPSAKARTSQIKAIGMAIRAIAERSCPRAPSTRRTPSRWRHRRRDRPRCR